MQEDWLQSTIRRLVPREVRNWIRSPRKGATWLWESARFKFGFSESLEISDGQRLLCHPIAYRSAKAAQIGDPVQAAEFRQFIAHCRTGMFLFDVGASFGIFSLACARLGGKAIAIEPSRMATKIISEQVKLNHLGDNVHVLEAAAGDAQGTIAMLSSGVYSDGYYRHEPARDPRELTRVPVTTVDLLAGQFGPPSHIKIDVEGFEATVLRGAREVLKQSSPLIFLELHNEMVSASGGDASFCLRELTNLGYKIFSVQGILLSIENALRPPICRILARPERIPDHSQAL